MDSFRSSDMIQDLSLSDWFKRPIKIATTDWQVGSHFNLKFDPWTLFWEDPANLSRISNYKMLQCTMKVKFVLNGNAFYYGRILASYNPLAPSDGLKQTRDPVDADFVGMSQKPHVFLNPTLSQGGTLELPFFYYRNAIDIVEKGWTDMGEVTASSLQILKHANGADVPITVSVFAWAENVVFSLPTHYEPQTSLLFSSPNKTLRDEFRAEAADEYGQGPISKPATTVARVAGALSKVPFIGNFARATEIGAKSLSSVASLFGYSAPTMLDKSQYIPVAKNTFAVTNLPSDNSKLSLDCKQEVSIDPAILGLNSDDEMTITGIASRESYLSNFNWRTTSVEEELLHNYYVDPCQARLYINPDSEDETHMTAPCVAALPFRYWRGTMRFRFQIVSSAYHKGRLKFVYDPHGGAASSPYNTAYTHVHDIEESTDFTIDVGWGQPDMFVQHVPNELIGNSGYAFATVPLPHASHSNGVLSVYVVNQLTVPNSIVSDNDVQVNVFVSMLDDFQVAQPTSDVFRWRLTSEPIVLPANFVAEAGTESQEMVEGEGQVNDPETLTTFASPASDEPNINHLFFGETVGSFKQLMKRFTLHEVFYNAPPAGYSLITNERTAYPVMGGYYPDVGGTLQIDVGRSEPYTFLSTNIINFLSPCYGGWRGSFRWCVDATEAASSSENFAYNSYSSSRTDVSRLWRTAITLPDPGSNITPALLLENLAPPSFDGSTRWSNLVNPIHTFEVPFYSNLRFLNPRRLPNFSSTGNLEPGYRVDVINSAPTAPGERINVAYNYVSTGEDFQLYFWLGPPVFYKELSLPGN